VLSAVFTTKLGLTHVTQLGSFSGGRSFINVAVVGHDEQVFKFRLKFTICPPSIFAVMSSIGKNLNWLQSEHSDSSMATPTEEKH